MFYIQVFSGAVMVVGQRADVKVLHRAVSRPESVWREVSALGGKLHPAYGIDYFAIARNRFPWSAVPRLIVGRPKYDNFLLKLASTRGVSLVDATATLTALHQTDEDGVGAGHRRVDSAYNRRVISSLRPLRGCWHIKCTEYLTRWVLPETGETSNDAVTQARKRVVVERRAMPSHVSDIYRLKSQPTAVDHKRTQTANIKL